MLPTFNQKHQLMNSKMKNVLNLILALVSCIWYMKTVKLCIHNLFHTEHKAEKDLDKKSR